MNLSRFDLDSAKKETIKVASMLLLSLFVRVILFGVPGYSNDLATYSAWMYAAAVNGIRPFYNIVTWCDYPPLNIYLFWLVGSISKYLSLFDTKLMIFMIKIPSNLFELATALMIFKYLRSKVSFNTSFVASALYAFNPATLLNSAIWGQYDGVYTFFLVLALILLLESRPLLSTIAFSLALLTKPQSIALVPLLIYEIYRRHGWITWFKSGLVAVVTAFIVILPFKWSNPVSFILGTYISGYSGYPYTSINAFNLWAFGGFWRPDSEKIFFLNFFTIGWILFTILVFFVLYYLNRHRDKLDINLLFSAFILFFGFFMLPTRIHERYLFPTFSVLALIIAYNRKIRPIFIALSFTCFINQAYVLSFLNAGLFIQLWDPVAIIISLMNLIVFSFCLTLTRKDLGIRTYNNSSNQGSS